VYDVTQIKTIQVSGKTFEIGDGAYSLRFVPANDGSLSLGVDMSSPLADALGAHFVLTPPDDDDPSRISEISGDVLIPIGPGVIITLVPEPAQ